MPVSNRHILEQGAGLAALGRAAWSTIETQLLGKKLSKSAPQVPGRAVEATLPPRSPALIRDYVKNVGGDPSAYKNTVPAHFFSQWSFGVAGQTFAGLPYPLAKILNVGCNLDIRGPIAVDEPLLVSARLIEVDDDGRRALLTTRVTTSTPSQREALIADMIAMVPLKRDKSASGAKKEAPRVPDDASERAFFDVPANAGLDFAKLTGDFNPIHWIKPAARASGFPNVILHGFGTMARAIEGLNASVLAGDPTRLKKWSCRFTKPLVLPAKAGLYTQGHEVFVGVAPGAPAYLVGSYEA
jgi:hypothetical protein